MLVVTRFGYNLAFRLMVWDVGIGRSPCLAMLMLIMMTPVDITTPVDVVYLVGGIVVCPLPHSGLYLGVLFLVEKPLPIFGWC